MKTGEFPDLLKLGKISPVFKKNIEELIKNYCPVSTLPIFGKIFEKVIYYKFKFKGSSGYWIVKNKEAVTSKLNYLNNMHYARSVSSFDF